jgi:anti-anti-sigma regulatory factor
MLISTTTEGPAAVVTPCGEITFDALPLLLAAHRTLPPAIDEVIWDLRQAPFMDITGLHLLVDQRIASRKAGRRLTITGLQDQPLRLVRLAQELFPEDHWTDFLPHEVPTAAT